MATRVEQRRIIEDLSPSSLRSLGLVPALEILCGEMSRHGDIDIACHLQGVTLSADKSLAFYRFVQEALTNIAKHSQARKAVVRLWETDGQAHAEVWDDGAGFDASSLASGQHGLRGMRFRLEAFGGHLCIDSSPVRGTRLTATLPQDQAAALGVPLPVAA